jgi:hypothetical protein
LHIVTLKTIVPEVDSEGISIVLPFTTVTRVDSLRMLENCQQVTNFTTKYLCRKLDIGVLYNVTLPKSVHSSAYTCSKNDHYIMMEHV